MEPFAPYDNAAPPVVTLELEGPRPQRRWTIALRILLAIPHWLWLSLVGIAYSFAVIVAWFAALVLGRLPDGLGTFMARVTQYTGRVTAYGMLLLTDTYPSFALDEPDYAVSVRVPWGGRLNRVAVFFRMLLVIPAGILYWFVWTGLGFCIVFIWLIVLITGRPPHALFEAMAAALRYQLRVSAYATMLTSEYPRGLFGDRGLAADVDAPLPMAPSAEAAVPPTPTSAAWPTAAGWPSETAQTAAPSAPLAPPRITTLVLSKAAKRILVLFIVLGAVFGVGLNALIIMSAGDAEKARDELAVLYEDVSSSSQAYSSAVQDCAVRQAGMECLRSAARNLRAETAAFANGLADIEFPAGAIPAADQVSEEVADVIDVLDRLTATSDPAEYQQLVADLQAEGQELDDSVYELDLLLANVF